MDKNKSSFWPGNVVIEPGKNPDTHLSFWYKDSEQINNLDELFVFVKDDASWAEKNQGLITDSIEKTVLGDKNVVLWKSIIKEGGSFTYYQQYYLADFGAKDVNFWIYTVDIETKNSKKPAEMEEIEKIIDSYNLLN